MTTVLGSLTATALLTVAAPASAQAAAAVPACPGGSVCFFSEADFGGSSWEWTAGSGYRDLPPSLHDHVGSFVASADACFIAYEPTEKRQARGGDWRRDYRGDFGGRMDAVAPGAC
ncbi:peptidase inhibitor family I36 protein [Streptomyces sp. NPDC058572]|uniref:peptidase inhibitor family I36 protein n=1 Tax=Streptomyces sp. NPDC058572 TaxID=3346546 RepID=UPI003652C3F5